MKKFIFFILIIVNTINSTEASKTKSTEAMSIDNVSAFVEQKENEFGEKFVSEECQDQIIEFLKKVTKNNKDLLNTKIKLGVTYLKWNHAGFKYAVPKEISILNFMIIKRLIKVVKYLLDNEALIEDDMSQNSLYLALMSNVADIVQLLLSRGANFYLNENIRIAAYNKCLNCKKLATYKIDNQGRIWMLPKDDQQTPYCQSCFETVKVIDEYRKSVENVINSFGLNPQISRIVEGYL